MLRPLRDLTAAMICTAALASGQAASGAKPKEFPSTCPNAPTTFGTKIYAGAGDDRAFGGDESVLIYGQEDDDQVAGGAGDDELHGGPGSDVLSGELGSDRFVYETLGDSNTGADGRWSPASGDTIVDFSQEDKDRIDVGYLIPSREGSPSSLTWSGTVAAKWSVWFRSADDTFVFVDVDGDAQADLAIRLLGQINLAPDDFCGIMPPD